MFEEISAFELAYAEAHKWMVSEQARLIALSRSVDLDTLEAAVAGYTDALSKKLLTPGKDLMLTEAFKNSSFEQQMGFTRFKLSKAAADGYASVSLVQRAISLQKNKDSGVIEKPQALKMAAERVEGSIGHVADQLSGATDTVSAADAYVNSQESIIKHSQIETIIASQKEGRGKLLEARRIVGDGETCTYCRGLAGYWTTQLYTLRHFHNGCKCKIVTRLF